MFVMNYCLVDHLDEHMRSHWDEGEVLERLSAPALRRATAEVSLTWLSSCTETVEEAYLCGLDRSSALLRWQAGPWDEGGGAVRPHQNYFLHDDTPGQDGRVVAQMVIQRVELDG